MSKNVVIFSLVGGIAIGIAAASGIRFFDKNTQDDALHKTEEQGIISKTMDSLSPEEKIQADFIKYSQKRVEEIHSEGPVVLVAEASNPLFALDQIARPGRSAPQATPPARPDTPTNAEIPKGVGQFESLTLNPAPFTDLEAAQSIKMKKAAFLETGETPVSRISRHDDGSRMTEKEKEENVRRSLAEIPDEWTVVYKSPTEKARAYVFTDTSCPFCKKLHADIADLLDRGVSVHYMLYPRDQANAQKGMLSNTASLMVNAWCSPNMKVAFDDAFDGYRIPPTDCADLPEGTNRLAPPVPDHFNLGVYFEVRATPTIFISNGKSFEGYSSISSFMSKAFD